VKTPNVAQLALTAAVVTADWRVDLEISVTAEKKGTVEFRAPPSPSQARRTLGLVGKRTSGAVSYERVINKC
jgi:hypothetical protein